MTDSTNNKELVAAGHEFARHISSDTPIIDIARMVTRLASQLDVTTVALRQANAELKALVAAEIEWEKAMMQAVGEDGIADVVSAIDALKKRTFTIKLPDGYTVRSGHPINEGERGVMIPKEGGDWLHRFDVEHAIRTAGNQLAAEEQQPTHEATDWQVDECLARMESEGDMVMVPRGLLGAALSAIKHPKHEAGVTIGSLRHYAYKPNNAALQITAEEQPPVRSPVLAYADAYRDMAKQGVESVPIWNVITDLERNIAPLYLHPHQDKN